MTRDVNGAFARTLVDEWARAGLTDAAVAPGSRSTPLALALAADDRIRVHVHLDERSAAFFALGAAKASARPVLVLSTSGTAAAHFHAAVLEAHHSRTPLLVCTADRPAELRETGAPQTVDQLRLYGRAARFFADLGAEDHPDAIAAWRPIAARAHAEAAGPPAGPVHVNLAFREPLVPGATTVALADVPGRPGGRPWTAAARPVRVLDPGDAARLAERVAGAERGLVVAGWGSGGEGDAAARAAAAAGWPLLADPLSGARSAPGSVSTYEALLRAPGFAAAHRPDLVVRFGAAPTSKTLTSWLDASVPQVVVDPDGAWLDPGRAAGERLAADPALVAAALEDSLGRRRGGLTGEARAPASAAGSAAWAAEWCRAEEVARRALDAFLDGCEEPFEGRVARDVADAVRPDGTLVVASSMPVRDVEAFSRPGPAPLRVLANRGTNGIDGFTSTVLGVAAVTPGPVTGLGGDLAFLHDAAGLIGASRRDVRGSAVVVVVDNDGGGIFSFLPQAEAVGTDRFEMLFGTPHGLDLVALARAYGIPAERVARARDVAPAVHAAHTEGGVRVIVVPTGDRAVNVARHREAWEAVARAL